MKNGHIRFFLNALDDHLFITASGLLTPKAHGKVASHTNISRCSFEQFIIRFTPSWRLIVRCVLSSSTCSPEITYSVIMYIHSVLQSVCQNAPSVRSSISTGHNQHCRLNEKGGVHYWIDRYPHNIRGAACKVPWGKVRGRETIFFVVSSESVTFRFSSKSPHYYYQDSL